MGCVYVLTNVVNGMSYVGLTRRRLSDRINAHRSESVRNNTYPLYRAIRKYGFDRFDVEVLYKSEELEVLSKMERHYIASFDTVENGYNIQSGGYSRYSFPESSRKAMSEKRKGKPGRPHTEEEKQKIRIGNLGKKKPPLTPEHKAAISRKVSGVNAPMYGRCGPLASCYGRTGDKHPLFGKKGADCASSKKVLCIETGELFVSATECAQKMRLNHSKVCMVCRGERPATGGYAFKYIEGEQV